MLKDFFSKLSRRRFGQALLAGAALFGLRFPAPKKPSTSEMNDLAARRGMARHAPTGLSKVSLREAEFYEVERRRP